MQDLYESLGFLEMPNRYKAIPVAYQKMFEWIFEAVHEVPDNAVAFPKNAEPSENQPADGIQR
jgi:hypothetical protein